LVKDVHAVTGSRCSCCHWIPFQVVSRPLQVHP
jgi:hypothetical protein